MTQWDLGELARAAEAHIQSRGLPVSIATVGTDSRSLPPACLFVALRGERFNGHDFVGAAIDAGAHAVLIDRAAAAQLGDLSVPALVCDDTLRALGDIAAYHRQGHGKPLVAITGSNGKTTTKELCAAALGVGRPVHKNVGNLNNLIGVPLTLLSWHDDAWAGVAEMGMNAAGEIARLTEIAKPSVGVITNVGAAHLEGLGDLDAIGRAKGELYAGLNADAIAVVNGDDEVVQRVSLPLCKAARRITFGRGKGCDVQIVRATQESAGLALQLNFSGTVIDIALPLLGLHNAYNAAAAAAAAMALEVDSASIAAGLTEVVLPGGRLRRIRMAMAGGTIDILDDTYNANPDSMAAALATQAQLHPAARRLAILGDMFELGATSTALHQQVGEAAAQAEVAWLLCLGQEATAMAEAARATGIRADAFADIADLTAALDAGVRPGDSLLVKGSRGMRMERVVQHFENAHEREAGED